METNGKYMVKIKILNNNSNNEATVNQKAINPFFQQMSSEKNNKPRQHLTCRFAAGKKKSGSSIFQKHKISRMVRKRKNMLIQKSRKKLDSDSMIQKRVC